MKLYIDTNIYLSFVNPTSDIKSLEKLINLIKENKVELVLPSQTKKEFLKHFKRMIGDAKEKIKNFNTSFTIPNELKDKKAAKYTIEEKEIIKQIDNLNKELIKYRKQKIDDLKKHIEVVERHLNEIFKSATFFEYSDEIVLKAVIRFAKCLPPKKNDDKFGDAIIWETLKENIRREHIAIVARDKDYMEKKSVKKNKPEIFKILATEWKKHTGKKVTLYLTLGEFVNTLVKKDKVSRETINREASQVSLLENQAITSARHAYPLNRVFVSSDNPSFFTTTSNNDAMNLSSKPILSNFTANNDNDILGVRNINSLHIGEISKDIIMGSPVHTKVCGKCGHIFLEKLTAVNMNGNCDNCNKGSSIYFS